MRRVAVLFVAVLLIAACGDDDSEDGPAATVSTTTTAGGEVVDTPIVALETDGLGLVNADSGATTHLVFGTDDATASTGVAAALGEATEEGPQDECPAGPAEISRFGDLTLTFQQHEFVGWTASHGSELTTVDGIGVGSTFDEVTAAYPDATIEQTSLGLQFDAGGLFGTIDGTSDDGTIEAIWAGTTCIFR